MDEQRAWIKSRRRKRLRFTAVLLSICLLVANYPDIWGTLSALAEESGGEDTRYVAGFEELAEEVREQTVPLGTEIEELTLPDTLEAFIIVEEEASEEEPAPEEDEDSEDAEQKEEEENGGGGAVTGDGTVTGGGEGTGEATEGETGDGTDETGTEENSGDGTGTDDNNGGNSDGTDTDDNNGGNGDSIGSTGDTTEETTDETPAADADDTDSTEAQQEQSAPEQSAPEEGQGESAPSAKAEPAAFFRETHTVTLPVYAAGKELEIEEIETLEPSPAGDAEKADTGAAGSAGEAPAANGTDDTADTDNTPAAGADSNDTYTPAADSTDTGTDAADTTDDGQPEQTRHTEDITIGDVTWESAPSYDGNTEGVYVFTAVLPEGYALAEGASLPEITVTVKESEQAKALAALLALLEALPDPEEYLTYDEAADVITEHEEMIDEEQLAEAREAADAYLEAYPDTDTDVTSGADTLATLLTRLEALEHIRDTVTDCMDVSCVYHYPQFVKERMNEDEIPELLTLEDLVEDYGIEKPNPAPVRMPAQSLARLSRAGYAAAPRAAAPSLHPQTLMFTEDNENNAHTGEADKDIDKTMSVSSGNHPVEISFTLSELPTQNAYLAVKAYDVDEESGEHDYVYLNDDIYKPMDKSFISNPLFGDKTYYNESNIGYLSGTNETWNVTVLKVPLEKLVKGKNVISITVANGWCVDIDWMQLILDGGAVDAEVESFSLKLSDVENSGDEVTLHADVTVKQKGTTKYVTEYTLTQEATGDALDACFGSAQTKESISFTMNKGLDTGTYRITGLLKDPNTEQIRAMDSVSFYFIKGEGVGPKVSHTLTPDTLTNGSVTIRVQAEAMPSVTNVTVPSSTRTVTANGRYGFEVRYQINGSQKSFTYYVTVDNIDKTPPVITYKPLTVLEDTPQADVDALLKTSLSASDDRKLADNPFTWTLPANISYLPGTKNVTVKAADAAGNITTKTCPVTVTAKPLQLTMKEPAEVSGSRDSFALKAVLTNTGTDTITKTGFVWGVMPNPTLEVKNGSVTTSSPVKTKGAALSGTATGIAYGVTYYARAYATLQSGSTVYSDSKQFGSGLPSYGMFNVSKVSGSTFTVTRTGGTDGKQTVYYRTVNGSAIGGTHFTHAAGSLIFADGETSKTVTVSEKGVTTAYNGNMTTSYSNADREYSLEIYRVEGGGKLDDNKANLSKTRTMTKNSNYTVSPTLYTSENQRSVAVNDNNKWVADNTDRWWRKVIFINDRGKNAGQGNKNFNVQRTMEVGNARENAYLKATADGYSYRLQLNATETDSGYEHIWISNHAPNNMRGPANDNHTDWESIPLDYSYFGHAYYTGRWEIGYHGTGTVTASFPSESGLGKTENPYRYKDSSRISGDWVLFDLNDTAHVWFAANGNKKNMWYVNSYTDWVKIRDTKEPKCIGVAPMAGSTYLPGDDITVALVFDEIVDRGNSSLANVSINTNVGTLYYKGGADTNVLYFTGTVQSGSSLSGSGALQVKGINNSGNIKDMCNGGSSTPSYSGNTNVTVDASKPSVTIAAQTSGSLPQHKAKITSSEAAVQYAWTKDAGMPAAGWQTADSGVTLTERRGSAGTSETWYLHVLATASSGAATHKYLAFTFMQPDITGVSVRAGNTVSTADVSDVWKKGKYIVAQYAGTQTSGTKISLGGPQTGTQNISAKSGTAAFYVTKNGVYTLTLTDSYNNVITKTIEVKKIDTENPTAAIQSGSQTGSEVTHNSVTAVITPADTGGSGVAKVEYAWTNSTSTPSSWATLTKKADGSYQTTYNATEAARTTKYLHVKVTDSAGNVSSIVRSGPYSVIKAATGNALPTITVTGNSTTWTQRKTLTWTAAQGTGGAAIKNVTIPTENQPITGKTNGSCTVTKNGNYLFALTDGNGNTVSKQVTVTTIDNEAPALTKVTATGGTTAKITLTGVTDDLTRVLDEKGNFTGMDGSGVAKREYQYENGSWQTFSGDSFTPDKNGTYQIRLTDNAGNVSEVYSVTLSNLDKTAPEVTCTIDASKNASGWYTDYPLPVVLTYEDPAGTEGGASGIASVQYKWITGSQTKPTAGLSSLNAAAVAGGTYTVNLGYYDNAEAYYLYYKVTDKTGNITEGFSDVIKKDSYKGSAGISGLDKGQPAETGLEMKLNSLSYGPSGGYVTGGTWAESGTDAAKLATIAGHTIAGQKIYSGTAPNYKAKTPGSNYFRFYPAARGGSSYYWAFYVRKVTFDSQGGGTVPAQLVWHDSTNNVKCTVTEPTVPTRTGYTFGGWYTDAACTAAFDFDTQLRADTTLYAKWTANKYAVRCFYHTPDNTTAWYQINDEYIYGEGYALPEVPELAEKWMDKGFAFDGWYTNENCTGTAYTSIGKTEYGNKAYYGRCVDVEAPKITSVSLSGVIYGVDGWYSGGSAEIYAEYSDNNGAGNVTASILVDGVEKTVTDGITKDDTKVWYQYHLVEGEHTYQWKLKDAAGNVTLGEKKTYKYDNTQPIDGTIKYDGVADVVRVTDSDNTPVYYLCGNNEVVLSVSMTDDRSGLYKLRWQEREKGGSGSGSSMEHQFSGEKAETAKLTFGRGTAKEMYRFDCVDKARKPSRSYASFVPPSGGSSIKTNNNWLGIIVENTAPTITLTDEHGNPLSKDWYESGQLSQAEATINDAGNDESVVSSGIKSYYIYLNGELKGQAANITDLSYERNPAINFPADAKGVVTITVEAEDHAGNVATKSVVVKIKGTEMTPAAKADYPADELCGLAPNALYQITLPASGGTTHTIRSDENGRLPFVLTGDEGGAGDMCGKSVQIIKCAVAADGYTSTPSAPQTLTIASRLDQIAADKIGLELELAPDAENAEINLNIEGVTGTKEYSVDSGTTWTDVPSDNIIQNLKKGDVLVRMKATDSRPHSLKTRKTIGESTGTITAVYDLNYTGAVNTHDTQSGLKGSDTLTKPADPSRSGYQFLGWYMEEACENEWRFTAAEAYKVRDWRKSGTSTTFDPVQDGSVYQITLYAKWRETTPPTLAPKLTTTGGTEVTNQENWYPNLILTADYSDNEGVTRLSVRVDGGDYKELDIRDLTPDGSNPAVYHYIYAVLEGSHTYQFKAEDEAGNWKESGTVTAKLDTVNPVLGEADFSKGYHSFWDWIVKNERLQITVPVADQSAGSGIEMSGIESVKYALTPTDGAEQEAKDADISILGNAVIQIAPDFKGTVRITAYDKAGNTDEKIIGTDGIKGVIVEDNAPEITILADRDPGDTSPTKTENAGTEISTAYYNSAPRLYVKVTDDKAAAGNALTTSGLQSVTWSVNGGAENQSGMNFETDTIKTAHSFTISALEGMDGTVRVTVKAVDQAGNEKTITKTVNIKTREAQPVPVIDYRKEILTGLKANAKYKVLGTDGTEEVITADGSGNIKIEADWFGREVQICKAGDGTTTLDSAKTDVKPAARPAPPKTVAEKAETVKNQADGIIAAAADASGLTLTTLEYSRDGGASWKPVTADMLTDGKLQNCAAGPWLFRVPACDTAPYGETTELVIGAGKTLTVSFEENGGSTVEDITDLSWNSTVEKPKDPVREGYEFMGWYQDADCSDGNEWHFEGENPVTVMGETDITLYAKWRDNVKPALGAVLVSPRSNGSAGSGQWYNNLSIALTYSDNTTVTALSVSVDGGNYTELDRNGAVSAGKGADGNVQYRIDHNDLTEGEHTYTFKAVDEGGNETTQTLTARLDKTNPETGTVSYGTGPAGLWDWIIGKDSLIITVPVTEKGSGVESVVYTLTPVGADGNGDESKATDGTADIKLLSGSDTGADCVAVITVPADFKGKVKVTARDKAGNTADEKTLGVDADGKGQNGIIVEDNAPEVSFMTGGLAVAADFYETPQDIQVTVDDTGDGITGGIASVQYEIKGEDGKTTSHTVDKDYTTSLVERDSFTVPADAFRPGVNVLTVKAVDHAGNSAGVPVRVKIKRPEATPDPKIDYVAERLTGLFPNAEYKIADVGVKADEKGSVAIDESWIGTTVSVIRMPGTGENTVSAAKSMAIPDRPAAPAVTVKNETYPDAGDGILTMTETGKMYQFSPDGAAWTDAETDENHQIKGLEAKDYYVRARAIENQSFRSKEGTVTVGTIPPTPYEEPNVVIDYENEKLTGLVPEAEYIVEYVELVKYYDEDEGKEKEEESVVTLIIEADKDGNIPVDEAWLGKEPLSVVQHGNGREKSDSEEAVLGEGTLPIRPGAPSPSGEDETGIRTGAKLTNLTSGKVYDISTDGGKTWSRKTADGSGVISGVDAPAEYIVRVAPVGGFSSPNSGKVRVDGYHIPVTFITDGVTTGTSWAYYGKAPQNIPAVPKKADAGDATYVGEWCVNVSGTPADLTNITAETTVYAYYTIGYNVTLQGGAGYTLAAAPGNASPVKEGADFTLQFTLGSGYEKTDSFAVKVNGVAVALKEDGTYTIENITEDQTVTVEGIRKKPSSGGSDKSDHDSDDQPGGENNPPAGDNPPDGTTTPGSTTPSGTTPDGKTPGTETPGGKNPDGKNPDGESPDGTNPDGKNSNGTNPDGRYPKTEAPEGKTPGGSDLPDGIRLPDGTKLTGITVPVTIEDGKIILGDGAASIPAGSVPGMEAGSVILQMADGKGAVVVTVVCEEETYTAGVKDTIAVANAVLTREQTELVEDGETIEILIDVKDITDSIPLKDKEIIEDGIEESRKDHPGLTLGMYIDISMFVKIGEGDWNTITHTDEPVDVVVGIPEELKADGREFTIIRSHDGVYTLLTDLDDNPDTITISTDLFSAYAIAYEETDQAAGDAKCGLCHICPTFLGICYFIWLALIIVLLLIIWLVMRRKKKEEERGRE